MISSISYFMGLLCFVFISVCFFNIRSLFIVLSGPCFNVLDCTAVKQLQALSLHTGSLARSLRELAGRWKASFQMGHFFSAVFFFQNHFPEQCHSTQRKSNLSHGGVLCQRATQAGRSG